MAYQSFFWSSGETFNIESLEIAQTAKNIWNFIVISRIYKKLQTSAIIQEISDSYLETRRNGSKSGVSRIIWDELTVLT